MKFNVAPDARPQLKTLLIATVLSIVLWFIPFAEYLIYPIRLFVTFIHEGGHVLASLITNSAIFSLTVAPDGSGAVLAAPETTVASLIISSAGYVGASAFGALLLILIRRAVQARIVLAATAGFIALMTLIFGFALPMWNFSRAEVSIFAIAFTVISGLVISGGLAAVARFATARVASFFLSFLAVQCLLNALFDLKTVFFMHSPFAASHVHSDAANMAQATGIPSIFWVVAWIGISLVLVSIGLRFYAVNKERKIQQDLPFED
ncbi:MAG TPA: M50 family metallopeptidase [Pyrinomonadaceae bacterium]|jgi:hypothetical protein